MGTDRILNIYSSLSLSEGKNLFLMISFCPSQIVTDKIRVSENVAEDSHCITRNREDNLENIMCSGYDHLYHNEQKDPAKYSHD